MQLTHAKLTDYGFSPAVDLATSLILLRYIVGSPSLQSLHLDLDYDRREWRNAKKLEQELNEQWIRALGKDTLTHLSLSNMRFYSLDRNPLKRLQQSSIRSLQLDSVSLSSLDPLVLLMQKMPVLEQLSINKLSGQLPPLFPPSLAQFTLSKSGLNVLQKRAFAPDSKLKHVEMSYDKCEESIPLLKYLPRSVQTVRFECKPDRNDDDDEGHPWDKWCLCVNGEDELCVCYLDQKKLEQLGAGASECSRWGLFSRRVQRFLACAS